MKILNILNIIENVGNAYSANLMHSKKVPKN